MLGGIAELLVALTVALLLTVSFLPIQKNLQDTSSAATAAWQVATLRDAAAQYIKSNWTTEIAALQGSSPAVLPVAALQPLFLPNNFGGATAMNPWRQNYAILLQYVPAGPPTNQPGIMGFVVSYGGTAIPPETIASAAALIGTYGGYSPYNTDPSYNVCTVHPCVKGIGNFYWQDMSGFAASPTTSGFVPASGHLAAGLFFSGGDQAAPYLYRVPEPGNPDLNTMQTDILMTDSGGTSHSLSNAKDITANGNITLTGASAAEGNIVSNGNITLTGASAASGNINANGNITLTGSSAATGNITASGNVSANGNVTSGATVTATTSMMAPIYYHNSDRTLKKNITDIEAPLALVEQLRGHRFQWRRDDSWDVGLVAQEVQQVMPEAVGRNLDGKLTVKYDVMVAPLIEAVKALDGRVQQLEGDLAEARRIQTAGQEAKDAPEIYR